MVPKGLFVRPITRDEAVEYVARVHRHNKRSLPGWKFGLALYDGASHEGIGIAGRCSSRVLDQRGEGHFIEITRVATDGIHNGCSKLYGSLLSAAKSLGYCRAYTYTLDRESGASLRAAGFEIDDELPARAGWDCKTRPRDEIDWPSEAKVRWIKQLSECEMHYPSGEQTVVVPVSFVESVLYSGSFEGEDLQKLYAEAEALLNG